MTRSPAVVCCGLTTLDLVQGLDAAPVPGSKMVATYSSVDVGGPAANAARTAALLGSDVVLHTLLGSGPFAEVARGILERDGVTVRDHTPDRDPWTMPVSAVLVTADGERTVVSSNASGAPAPIVDPGAGGAAVVLVDGHHADLAVAAIRAHPQACVLLDGGSWKPDLERLLPDVDIAVVSADFRAPASALSLLRTGITWARTNGAGDVEVARRGEQWLLPVPRVAAVDTLGAGDVLHGAVAHALASNGDLDPVEAIRWAIPVASSSCAHRGVTTWARENPADATR